MTVQQDEAQEGFEEGGLRHAAQEEVQVGGAGNHLVHRRLQTHTNTHRESASRLQKEGSVTVLLMRSKPGSETIPAGQILL